ncbi:oligosaccharide repeat unit polymerase, partial [Salmonella enterica]|nr:oligosaccharide repeat unit polymerase [Salmonella enterica]
VPFVIRAISGFTVTMALAVFYFKSPSIIKFIAFILLASDLIIGIRNKFFFSMICIFILYLYSNEIRVKHIFKKISKPTVLLVGFILFSLVSYFREGYQINFVNYIGIVLDSLSSTLGGMQNLFSGQIGSWDKLSPEVVFTQILPLSGLGFINNHQIAKDFSIIVLGDVSSGIALSSSGLLESTILSLHFGSV